MSIDRDAFANLRDVRTTADKARAFAHHQQLNRSGLYRFQMAWLRQVRADAAVSDSAFSLAFFFCDTYLLNEALHIEVPRKEMNIGKCGRTLSRLFKLLAAHGHIEMKQQGRGLPNAYWLILKRATTA